MKLQFVLFVLRSKWIYPPLIEVNKLDPPLIRPPVYFFFVFDPRQTAKRNWQKLKQNLSEVSARSWNKRFWFEVPPIKEHEFCIGGFFAKAGLR